MLVSDGLQFLLPKRCSQETVPEKHGVIFSPLTSKSPWTLSFSTTKWRQPSPKHLNLAHSGFIHSFIYLFICSASYISHSKTFQSLVSFHSPDILLHILKSSKGSLYDHVSHPPEIFSKRGPFEHTFTLASEKF